jgi:branched-chain amino acid transport system substrate-binding protein
MRRLAFGLCLGLATVAVAACGSSGSGSGGGGPVVIGTSVSKTGALAFAAPQILAGYDQAISQVNAAGGLDVGGKKRTVKLVVLDNASDPNQATAQVHTLVDQDGAVALLGAATPPINQPEASVAESLKTPFITAVEPVNPWIAAGRKWHYAFQFGFDNRQAIADEYKALDGLKTNKKIALFTDNEIDGQQWSSTEPQFAAQNGYKIVSHAVFPVGTTDYKSFVLQAKSAGADVVIAQMQPPDGIALWKQMKALGYTPKAVFCEKCGATAAFVAAVGPASDGTMTAGFWTSKAALPDTAMIESTLGKKFPDDPDLALAVWAYTAPRVLMDAIVKAGSTDAGKVQAALAATNASYPIGHIQFTDNNSATTPSYMEQWQGKAALQVVPSSGSTVQFPADGFK